MRHSLPVLLLLTPLLLAAAPSSGNYGGLMDAFQRTQHRMQRVGDHYFTNNPENRLHVEFTCEGVSGRHPDGDFILRLRGFGYGEHLAAPQAAGIQSDGDRIEYRRGRLTEWYSNQGRGLEQGFTLRERPNGAASGPLTFELQVAGDLRPVLSGSDVRLERNSSEVLRYSGLRAADAAGRELPARLEVRGKSILLRVEDAGAAYPVTIDPWIQQQELAAADGTASNLFGVSVSVSGDTAVVGAPYHQVGSNFQEGAAYVFVRNGSVWTQQQELTAPDGLLLDNFGNSVAVDGDTAVVGAYLKNGVQNQSDGGAAYVFVRNGTVWTMQQRLSPSDPTSLDHFGYSVALNGDTAVIGTLASRPGSAYVFVRSGSVWTQQQKLTAADGGIHDSFGNAVAVNLDTAVVGAPNFGSTGTAYVFARNGTVWSQQQELVPADGQLNDHFGNSTAVSGSSLMVGSFGATIGTNAGEGAAYVYVRSGTVWSQQQKLVPSDGAGSDRFGNSVALNGDTAAVGAPGKQITTHYLQGAVYVFQRSGTVWTQQPVLLASDGAINDQFGTSVSVNSATVLVGAEYKLVGANSAQGAAYAFVNSSPSHVRGDFDANGVPDVGLQFPDGSMGVWYLGGTGRQLPITGFAFLSGASSGITLVNLADLNADGVPDLILRFNDGSIGVWYIGGPQRTTITGFAFISGPIQGWVPAGLADLNGDGHLDLVIQNSDNSVGVWYLGGAQGNQIQGFAPISGPIAGWKVVGVADLNNDAHPDAIIQYTDGSVGTWYLGGAQGNQIQGFALIAGPSGWAVSGVNDMDNDGHPDLTIRYTDGTLGVWYLGGTGGNQITGFTPITTPGHTDWTEIGPH